MVTTDYRYKLETPRLTGRRQQKFQCPQCGSLPARSELTTSQVGVNCLSAPTWLPLSPERATPWMCPASGIFCLKTFAVSEWIRNFVAEMNLFKFRMYCRYKKIKEDMPLSAAKIEDNTYGSWLFAPQTNVIYLLLSSSNSLYLQSKRNFRKLNELKCQAWWLY